MSRMEKCENQVCYLIYANFSFILYLVINKEHLCDAFSCIISMLLHSVVSHKSCEMSSTSYEKVGNDGVLPFPIQFYTSVKKT